MTEATVNSISPLTPADCDLTDFAFMPLDVARLRDSELASNETPEACWAAVLLWAAAWHQVPAASIPNDDKWIAKAAGYALRGKIDKAWHSVRAGAMRGWVECSDGRLYHPVVAEKAREAWTAKLKQRWGTECARIKKHNDRHEGANVPKPTFEDWMAAGCPVGQPLFVPRDSGHIAEGQGGEIVSKRQGEGQGQRQGDIGSAPTGAGGPPPEPPPPPPAPRARTAADEADAKLWRDLKTLFVERHGARDFKEAGVLLGKLASKYGSDTFKAAGRELLAVVPAPGEPHTYLVSLCETAAGKRPGLNKQAALEDSNQAAAAAFAGA